MVYYDCYPYACEPTCVNKDECSEPASECYSGCFCPDGMIKQGDQCIKVQQCRDCKEFLITMWGEKRIEKEKINSNNNIFLGVCSGLGDSTYLTFDGALTFNGNCTYLATREKNPSGNPKFEVLLQRWRNGYSKWTFYIIAAIHLPYLTNKILINLLWKMFF